MARKQVGVKTSASSPLNIPPQNPEFEKPLVAVTVNNPFKKLLYWLDQIRRHQTTTFAIKLSIPLIALPIVIAAIFTLGRMSGINFQKQHQASPAPSTNPAASQKPSATPNTSKPDPTVSRAGTLKIAVGNQTRYLLSLRNGTIVVLDVPSTIDLLKYKDKQVLVTGTLDSTANVLKVTDIAQVQIFNPTEIPATPSAE